MIPDLRDAGAKNSMRPRIAAAHRMALMVLIGFGFSIAVYTVIGIIFLRASEPGAEPPQLRIPFYVGALFLALGSIALRRTQLRGLKLQAVAGLRGIDGLLRHFVNVTIISGALAEVIGLLGLLLGFFGGDRGDVLTLGAVALMVIFSSYPRRAAWEKTVEYFASNTPD